MKSTNFKLLALIIGLLLMSSGNAATLFVRNWGVDGAVCNGFAPCATVSYALAQASAGDTIDIGAGAYEVVGLVIDKDITLSGAGRDAPGNTILRAHQFPGQATSRVLNIISTVEVEIAELVIANGMQPLHGGGGIANSEGILTLNNVSFRDNHSGWHGGGLLNANEATLTNVVFNGNSAARGGGIYNFHSNSTLDNVSFIQNMADDSGGGIYNLASSPTLADGLFVANQAGNNGGAIFNEDNSSPRLTRVTIHHNSAENGGGIYNLLGSSPILDDVYISSNQAGNFSGGMHNRDNSSPHLTNVQFVSNSAGTSGGGMNNREGTSPHLTNVDFISNSAGEHGGGMFNITDSSPTLENVTFHDNVAGEHGGGMYNYTDSHPNLRNVTFTSNTAGLEGGGMRNFSSSVTLINAAFYHNSATAGGGMSNNGGTPSLLNVTIGDNYADERGGGIYNFESSPTLVNTIIWANLANQGNEFFNHVQDGDMTLAAHFSLWAFEPDDFFTFVEGSGSIDYDFYNVLHDDPLFVDPANEDLRLSGTSPARDAGDPSTDPSLFPGGPANPVDLDGGLRFYGVTIDIGAYEFQPNDIIFADDFES